MIKDILISILIVLFITLVLIAAGLGIGASLHWLLPLNDLGMASLIGLIALCIAIYAFVKFMDSSPSTTLSDDDFEEISRIASEPYTFRKPRRRKARKTV